MKPTPLFERGIYMPRCYDKDGYRYIIAIDSCHRRVYEHRIFRPEELTEQTAMLARWLDWFDPIKESA